MGSSNASRNGRGGTAPGARHAKHAFDEGEEGLFCAEPRRRDERPPLDRRGTHGRRGSPDKRKARTFRHARAGIHARGRLLLPVPSRRRRRKAAPAPRPASDPSETAAFLAAAAQRHAPSSTPAYAAPQQPTYAAPEPQPEPELEPPVMDLDDLANRQFAFDSWAAADLDETSAGMPALDIPVNPLFAAAEERNSAYDNTAAYDNRPSEQPRAGRIETEDYGQTSRGYSQRPVCRHARSRLQPSERKGSFGIVVYPRRRR